MSESGATAVSTTSADAEYRYKKFTTRLLFRDLRFRREAARAGDPLPAFELITTQGDRMKSGDLAGDRPLLLIFGSLTCPMTASAMPSLFELYAEFGKRIEFVMLNVREAHPGEFYPQPDTIEEKLGHARALKRLYEIPWTVVIDDIGGDLHRRLDPKPNSAFLMDVDGIIVFRSLWASDRTALRQALESAANGKRPARSESTALVVPVARAMGHVHQIMKRAGPQAARDLWLFAFPMALAGRIATIFSALPPDRRGVSAVLTLAFISLFMLGMIGLWVFG